MSRFRFVASLLAFCFGSAVASSVIEVDGRAVQLGPGTTILVDDQLLLPGQPLPRKQGLRVEVRYAGAALRGVLPEAAQTVVFSYALRGPITSTTPLRVLGQEVGLNAGTGSEGLPGGSFDNLAVGDHVDVSGYVDTNSSLLASFLEYSPEPIARWLLTGYVTAVNPVAGTADLGPQRISTLGVSAVDCGAGLAVGQFIEIRADANPDFGPGTALDQITSLRCVAPVPIGTPGALGALHGLVGAILAPDSFQFGPYVVTWDANTEFLFGAPGDLAEGADIEMDGVFGEALAFSAQGIQFAAPMVRLEGPVAPADVVSGPEGRVTLLGLTVHRIAQLRDRDGIYANGIGAPLQVEIRGYLDPNGVLFATRARERGTPDLDDVRVGGPVASVTGPVLRVLGIDLDTTGATFEDPAGNPISAAVFFAAVGPGALVEQSGSYDPAARRLSGGVMALILAPPPATPPPGAVSLLVGTLGDPDRVFTDGFETRDQVR